MGQSSHGFLVSVWLALGRRGLFGFCDLSWERKTTDRRTGDGEMAFSSEIVHCHSIQSAQDAKTTVFCGITLGLSQKIIREVWKYILKT